MKKGFTLIELLVILAIIGISAIMIIVIEKKNEIPIVQTEQKAVSEEVSKVYFSEDGVVCYLWNETEWSREDNEMSCVKINQ